MRKFLNSIKYFFWLLSGSNIEILKECPTDHNRHANIGLAIFVTTAIAFATGALAGYEFGNHTIESAILFGVIWSLLVFTIDRTMVLTLKKNPKITKTERIKSLIVPVLYRLFLSALISFFISIPLELWVFRENIAEQMDKDKVEKIIQKQKREQEAFNISSDSIAIRSYNKESYYLDSLLNSPEPPANYRNYSQIKNKLTTIQGEYKSLTRQYEAKVKQRKQWWSQVPYTMHYKASDTLHLNPIRVNDKSSNAYKQWLSLWLETKNDGTLTRERKDKKIQKDNLETQLSAISKSYFDSKTRDKNKTDSLKLIREQELLVKNDSIKSKKENYSSLIESHNGFTTKWVALNNVDDFWVIFFIWFIRIVFFTIEMLPTMSKISTPIGSYDRTVYSVEKRKEKYLDEIEDLDINKLKTLEKQKLDNELNVQKNILDKLSEKQNNIANTILEEWEKGQLKNIKNNLNNFVN